MVERAARGSCKDSDEEEKVEVAVNVIFEIFHAVFSLLEMNSSDKAETYLLVVQESPTMVQVPTQSLNPQKGDSPRRDQVIITIHQNNLREEKIQIK